MHGAIKKSESKESVLQPDGALEANKMGWFSGMCLVIGLMIGSGIFSTPAKVVLDVGTPAMAMIMWFVGGFITFAGTFCYMELGCMLPSSGGEQAYLEVAFQKPKALIAFLFCWSMIICVRPGAAAADSVIFAKYLLFPFIPIDEQNPWLQKAIGVICISSITLLNAMSTQLAIKIHDILTVVKIFVLLLISIMGLGAAFGGFSYIPKPNNWQSPFVGISTNGGSYASALFKIFWAYELREPRKNLPKAAGLGVAIVTTLYLIANFSYFTIVPLDVIHSSSELLAGTFFTICFGDVMGKKILPIFIAFSAYGAVCAMVFSASRVIYASAKANVLPWSNVLGSYNKKLNTPVNALMLNWLITLFFIIIPGFFGGSSFNLLVDMVGYPTWVFYGLSVVGLISMRKTHSHLVRPIKVWIPVAIIFVLASVFLTIFPFVPQEDDGYPYYLPPLLGVIFIVLGFPVWYFAIRGKDISLDFVAEAH